MHLALATLETGVKEQLLWCLLSMRIISAGPSRELIARAHVVVVTPKQKVTEEQARDRREADGFKINGEIYVKPDRFKCWIPAQPERNALKEQKVILIERETRPPSRKNRRYQR